MYPVISELNTSLFEPKPATEKPGSCRLVQILVFIEIFSRLVRAHFFKSDNVLTRKKYLRVLETTILTYLLDEIWNISCNVGLEIIK